MISTNGTMQCAGTSYTWMKEHLCAQERFMAQQTGESIYTFINQAIEKAAPGCNGLYYIPYLCGERCPRWDADAKGGFYGLKMEHTHEDMLRSVVEGIAYNMRLILDVMKPYTHISEMSIMGGLVKSRCNLKILADILGVSLSTLNYYDEATSVGAAVLAGVGSGMLKDFDEVTKFSWITDKLEPDETHRETYEKMLRLIDQTYYAMKDIYSHL